ncbi:uncharacterized protein LOC141851082 [Brevipalpus obovatus]|uniref:uncharacterized protein LOC141851082 n=1 Tax=Brevipalpus obovatus TaxID=246614 RepID=UPI003D9F3409
MFKRQKLLPDLILPDLKINDRASPEPPCSICLGTKEEKSFANNCYHSFCKICLTEWSKVKPECPVCRQPFDRIIFRVKSVDNYEECCVESYRHSPLFDDHLIERLTSFVMPHSFMSHPDLNLLMEPYRERNSRRIYRSVHHRERPLPTRERPDPSNMIANRSLRAFRAAMDIQRQLQPVITSAPFSFLNSTPPVSIGVPSPMTATSSSSHRQMHTISNQFHDRNETGTISDSGESQVRRNQLERPKRHPAPPNQSNHDEPTPGPSGLCPGSGQGKRKFLKVDEDDSDEVLCVGHVPSCTTSSAPEPSSSRSEPLMPNLSSDTSSSDDSNDSVVLVVEDSRPPKPPKPPKTPELIDIVSDSDDTDAD